MGLNQKQVIERFRVAAGGKGRWTEDDLYGYFRPYRPSGKGIPELLHGIEHGEAIAKRILKVMKADNGAPDWTFMVRRPIQIAPKVSLELMKQYISRLAKLAIEFGEEELHEELDQPWKFCFSTSRFRDTNASIALLEQVRDFVGGLVFAEVEKPSNGTFALFEPIVTSIFDYFLAYHIVWPMVEKQVKTPDPFEPYAKLWLSQTNWRIGKKKTIELFLPK
jgi:hypothetical protein